jgi:hypothetical protein
MITDIINGHWPAVIKSLRKTDCGANAQGGGGFQPGNTCAGKDGASDPKVAAKLAEAERLEAQAKKHGKANPELAAKWKQTAKELRASVGNVKPQPKKPQPKPEVKPSKEKPKAQEAAEAIVSGRKVEARKPVENTSGQESGAGERSEPKRLTNLKEIPTFARKNFPAGDKFAANEVEALTAYAGTGFSRINNGLRRNDGDIARVQAKKTVEGLDAAIKRGRVPEDLVVYRGMKGGLLKRLNEGDTFQDHGYVSTSLHKKVAEKFGKDRDRNNNKITTVMEITVPKGSHAIAFDAIFQGGHLDEHELLLPRNSTFKVTSVKETGGTKVVSVAYVPQEASIAKTLHRVYQDYLAAAGLDDAERFVWNDGDVVIGEPKPVSNDPVNGHWDGIAKSLGFIPPIGLVKNCGTGAGGFQPGNTCGKEDGNGSEEKESASTSNNSGGDHKNDTPTQAHKDNPKIHEVGEAPTFISGEDGAQVYNRMHLELDKDEHLKKIEESLSEDNPIRQNYGDNLIEPAYNAAEGFQVHEGMAALLKVRNCQNIAAQKPLKDVPLDKVKSFVAHYASGNLGEKYTDVITSDRGKFPNPDRDPRQAAVAALQDLWADTSGDHNKWAQAVQIATEKYFGLKNAYPSITNAATEHGEDDGSGSMSINPRAGAAGILHSQASEIVDVHKEVINAFLESTYQHTQEKLKAAGVETITLYRGMGVDNTDFAETQRDSQGRAFFPKETLQLQPLSSFSTEFGDAMTFASQNSISNKLVMAIKVPRERIFSTALTGPGMVNEHEMVVLGGKVEAKTVVSSTNFLKEEFWKGQTDERGDAWFKQTFGSNYKESKAYQAYAEAVEAQKKKSFSIDVSKGLVVFADSILKNCGTGSGGFQPGNTCGKEDGGGEEIHATADADKQAKLETLGMKRKDLPQIRGEDKPEFLGELAAKGIAYENKSIAVKDLKGVQGEYDPQRVGELRDNIAAGDQEFSRPLVSNDGYIIDGHHRWRAAYEHNPDYKLDVIQIDMPVKPLLEEVASSSKAFSAGIDQVPGKRVSAPEQTVTPTDAEPVDSPEFKRWFGNSKAVDANGKPMVMYHGTASDFNAFDGATFVTDDENEASRYAEFKALLAANPDLELLADEVASEGDPDSNMGGGSLTDYGLDGLRDLADINEIELNEGTPKVIPLYVKAENPLDLRDYGSSIGSVKGLWDELHSKGLLDEKWNDLDDDVKNEIRDEYRDKALYTFLENEGIHQAAFKKGYDSIAFVDQALDGQRLHDAWLLKEPEQLKAAKGNTTFDPADKRIHKTQTKRGDLSTRTNQSIIDVVNGHWGGVLKSLLRRG